MVILGDLSGSGWFWPEIENFHLVTTVSDKVLRIRNERRSGGA